MQVHRGLVVVAVALAAGLATCVFTPAAHAQWLPDHPYSIRRLGLFGTQYVSSTGYSNSTVFALSNAGHVCGTADRLSAEDEQVAWAYNPVNGVLERVGLLEPPLDVRLVDGIGCQTATGQIAAVSQWVSLPGTSLGARTWVHVPATAAAANFTDRTGLTSSEFSYRISGLPSGRNEYAFSEHRAFNDAGWIAGVSLRFRVSGDAAGQGAWVYNPVTRRTERTGLFDAAHTLIGNYQLSEIRAMTPSGQVVGVSARSEDPEQQRPRQSVWVYLPATNTTLPLGAQIEADIRDVDFQNVLGHIAIHALRPATQNVPETQLTFAFDPLNVTQTRTGLLGPGYENGISGEFSSNAFQNFKGDLAGISHKFAGLYQIGQNAWFYNATLRTSTAIGLTGAAYTGVAGPGEGGGVVLPAGYQYSEPRGIDVAGRTSGISARITGANTHNGQNTWLYRPTSNATVQIGLSGAPYSGNAGYQFSEVLQHNKQMGRVVGYTRLITGLNAEIGQSLWIFDADALQAKRAGLSGPAWSGSSGAEFTGFDSMNAAGGLAGFSKRFTGNNTEVGQNTWVWLPQQLDAVQTGLTTAAHTSGSYQFSQNIAMDEAGRVVGWSQRLDGSGMDNGQNIWVYDPATNTTVQTGLTATAHTGSGGYQFSDYVAGNAAGQMVGTSRRITGVSIFNGDQDVWYYDAATGVTQAVFGMVSGSRAFAEPMVLTDDGTLYGRYAVYSGPGGSRVSLRAFAFRPDRGFADLGSLVDGGLAASGWSTLQVPAIATSVNQVVGLGLANVGTAQTPVAQPGGQSVFMMVPYSCPADLGQQGGLPGADGVLDNNDFIVFIDYFFSMNSLADLGVQGGLPGQDSLFDNNDFVVFIDEFFAGCG